MQTIAIASSNACCVFLPFETFESQRKVFVEVACPQRDIRPCEFLSRVMYELAGIRTSCLRFERHRSWLTWSLNSTQADRNSFLQLKHDNSSAILRSLRCASCFKYQPPVSFCSHRGVWNYLLSIECLACTQRVRQNYSKFRNQRQNLLHLRHVMSAFKVSVDYVRLTINGNWKINSNFFLQEFSKFHIFLEN